MKIKEEDKFLPLAVNQIIEKLIKGNGNNEECESSLNDLFNKHGEHYSIYYGLGCLNAKKNNYNVATIFFKKSADLNGDFAPCLSNLSACLRKSGDVDLAKEAILKAIDIEKSNSDFYSNLSACLIASGQPGKALEAAEKALLIDKNNSSASYNKGVALLELGVYEEGFELYEKRKIVEDKIIKSRDYAESGTPYWDGVTKGKRIVVIGEQGIGDEIMFASCLKDLSKDNNIIFDSHPRLSDIFRDSFNKMGIFVVGTRKENNLNKMPWVKLFPPDFKINIGSLPRLYRKEDESFPKAPYLMADDQYIKKYSIMLQDISSKIKIGFSWKGGVQSTNMRNRKIELEELKPIFDLDADFISLQYNEDAGQELDSFLAKNPKYKNKIHHWENDLKDYDYTAGLVKALDIVVSVPQSVVHLCGGLGVRTIQLCPKKALWQMGTYGEDMPWYSSVMNIWQDQDEQWGPVIKKLGVSICNTFQTLIKS